MARVYLARDEKHGRDVAIKVIKSDLSASLGHERFLREIEIAARLRHPNIVPLYDSGEANGSLFFVMPYEDGQSLRERLRESGALAIADALSVLRDVARALAHAHEHGVVHRDIKPDNVMRSGDAAVVTDFGIAKAVSVALTDTGDATLTQAGTVIGTPAYMAPEQATGDASTDHRADIYSFGCLGYELFAGHPPFQETTSHLLIAAHIATTPRPIAELRSEVPAPVADLLARCLAKAPADRPQSAREFLPILDGTAGVALLPLPTATPNVTRRVSSGRKWAIAALLAAIMATGTYEATNWFGGTAPITLAVLPFANIAGDSAIDFVADGLADEVASALARVPGIMIKSRAGALAYRGRLAPDVTEAGARLKADYLMTAVIRQDRGRWVLSAELERAADARSLWDDRFVLSPNEQAGTADRITASLAAALRRQFPRAVGLTAARPPNQHTPNSEAHRLYLLGLGRLIHRGQRVDEAVMLFRQAISQDTLYADAYSGLAMALALMPWFHRVPPTQVHDSVVTAASNALRLDSTLALPHVALGRTHLNLYDWRRAESEFETAIRLDPANVEARVQYGWLLRNTARYTEALTQLRVAKNQDPASALVLSHFAYAYAVAGQMDSALAEIGRAFATDSTNVTTRVLGAPIYLKANRLKEAHAIAVQIKAPYVLAKTGDLEAVREELRKLNAQPRPGRDGRLADIYLALGDTANALSALERATDAKDFSWAFTLGPGAAHFDAIRHSARFRDLIVRVGLGDYVSALTR
jgi:serine/threonine-protein kinase